MRLLDLFPCDYQHSKVKPVCPGSTGNHEESSIAATAARPNSVAEFGGAFCYGARTLHCSDCSLEIEFEGVSRWSLVVSR
jgi:hypothetical protein